jgi:pimeloyl-ACP methyl ester carboxylesterase
MKYALLFASKISSFLVLLPIFLTLSHCSDTEDPTIPVTETLVKAVLIGSYPANTLQTIIPETGIDINASLLKYGVDVYVVTYKTKYKGEEIIASGLAGIPKNTTDLSILSLHHGTITQFADAPSATTTFGQQALFCAAFSSLGLITIMPDFIGFGESKSILHPYYVEELSASAVIDNLKAVKELAGLKKVTLNKDVLLAGYSEGGYVTMAAHKSLEQNPLNDFNLLASFPAAGGYDIKEMQEYVFDLETFNDPYYLAYLVYAYQTTYSWTQPLSDYFNQPYATSIPGLFNGLRSGSQINAQLTTNVEDLLSANVRTTIDQNPLYSNFVTALNDNSLTDWTPSKPMYMYHGTADETVPYSNSVAVYNQLIANGASPNTVTLTSIPGGTHGSAFIPYVEALVAKLVEINF